MHIPFPTKKYDILYADPPWQYGFFHKHNKITKTGSKSKMTGSAQEIYDTMSIDDIKNLPVDTISEKNSVLFLWVTMPCLPWGLEVIQSWGFDYKTCGFTWVKKNKSSIGYYFGLGNYTRANAELCLLATKGKPLPRVSKKVHSIIDKPLTAHSKKPDITRKRIVELFGDLPRIELFGRTRIHGWDVWGNDEKLQLEPLESY